jgi:hypothetical protein
MRRFLNALVLGSLMTIGLVQSFGCGDDGPAEEAGEEVDEAIDKLKK